MPLLFLKLRESVFPSNMKKAAAKLISVSERDMSTLGLALLQYVCPVCNGNKEIGCNELIECPVCGGTGWVDQNNPIVDDNNVIEELVKLLHRKIELMTECDCSICACHYRIILGYIRDIEKYISKLEVCKHEGAELSENNT